MSQPNKTSPVLYTQAELRHRDQLRESSQQKALDNKQLRKSFSDIRDVDDFRKALVDDSAEEIDVLSKQSNVCSPGSSLDCVDKTYNSGNPEDDHQESRGRWITESEMEKHPANNTPPIDSPNSNLVNLLQQVTTNSSEWQQFELETATVGCLCFSVKRDEQGICLKLSAREPVVGEILNANWDAIASDLSEMLGLRVRLMGGTDD